VLYKKKPVGDSKVLRDLVGEEDVQKVEFSIMVMGGAAVLKKGTEEVEAPSVAQGQSGHKVLGTEEFWGDLKGFLLQRLRDETEGEKVYATFRKAWEKEGK